MVKNHRAPPSNKRMTPDDEKLIIQEYKKGKSASQILGLLEGKFKTNKTIYDILKKYNVITRDWSDYNKIDHFYFSDINSPAKAYILGLMITDGWVASVKNQVAIQLQEQDKYMIEFIRDEFKSDNNLIRCTKKPFKSLVNDNMYQSQPMYRIDVRSPRMVEDLNNFGVVPNKSKITVLPVLKKYQSHMIRGIMDGDGTIYKHSQTGQLSIRFLGSHYLVAQIILYLYMSLGVSYRFPSIKENISIVDWYVKKDVLKIIKYMYKDSEEIRLERKYEIVKDYLK